MTELAKAGADARQDGALALPSRWWLAGYIAATFFAFPHPLHFLPTPPFEPGTVLDLGMVVSFLVAPLLVSGIEGLPLWRAVRRGFVATTIGQGLVLHFIYVVTVRYGHAPIAVGLIAPFLLGCYAGVLGGLFAAGWTWLRRNGVGGPFAAALLWTALDYLRSMMFSGWPWATLGYAQHLNPAMLGLAQVTSVYGLSFAVVLGGCGVAELVRARGQGRRAMEGFAAVVLVLFLHLVGFALDAAPGEDADAPPTETIRVAALQGNIDQSEKWDPTAYRRTLERYERLTRSAASAGALVIVWPETAVPGVLDADRETLAWLEGLAHETGAVLLVGSVGGAFATETGAIERFFDSAFVVEPRSGVVARYDKTHLVPFGEYVPMRALLGRLLGAVARGIARGDVSPGAAPAAHDFVLLDGRSVRLGTPICYELLFPDLVRKFVSDGGGMLLAITNDAWYGRTGAPHQFLAITQLRSAETGVWTVRSANTGVTAIIDSRGRVREQIPIFEPGLLVADVPVVREPEGGTFYVRYGDVFARVCCALLGGIGWVAIRRGRGLSRSAESK